jgi:hypothetical protein
MDAFGIDLDQALNELERQESEGILDMYIYK